MVFYLFWFKAVISAILTPVRQPLRVSARFIVLSLLLWLALGITSLTIAKNHYTSRLETISLERKRLEEKLRFLQEEQKTHPTARDLLYNIALISYQLGDSNTTREALTSLKTIDPNNSLVKELQTLISQE